MRLDSLEAREMPGNVWEDVFLGLIGGGYMLEPLMVMSGTFGETAFLPEPPPSVPPASPTEPTTADDSIGNWLDQPRTTARTDEALEHSPAAAHFGWTDGWDGFKSAGLEDLPDLSVPEPPTRGESPPTSTGTSGGSSGGDSPAPSSRLSGESPSAGPATFDGRTNHYDSGGESIAEAPATGAAGPATFDGRTNHYDSGGESIAEAPATGAATQAAPGNGQSPANVAGGTIAAPLANVPRTDNAAESSDIDSDGVPRDIEERGPNRGDGNRDGKLDSTQADVASLRSALRGEPVTIESLNHRLENVRVNSGPLYRTAGVNLPYGLFGFEVHNVVPGGTTAVRIFLPEGAKPTSYYKENPSTGRLESFDFSNGTGALFNGNVVTLYLQDGGRGDSDGSANGVIVDPGGPGSGGVIDIANFGVTGWTNTQSGGTVGGRGTVTTEGSSLVMREGDSFVVTLERDITIPADTGTLTFQYTGRFDTTDPAFINDAFEVALVDAQGRTLAPTVRANRDTFFNLTEELPKGLGTNSYHSGPPPIIGTNVIDVSGKVDLDISQVPAATVARLILRLVNDDGDTGTTFTLLCRTRPVGVADTYSVNEDTALPISAPGVLANDSDPNGDPITAVLVGSPAHGAVSLNPNGSFNYDPAANFNGTDTFTYKARDNSNNDSDVTTVTMTVVPVNDAPTAANDSYSTNEDTPVTISPSGVLVNDSDVDSSSLTAVLAQEPTHGSVALNANGGFTYTPSANFNGTDTFSYRASDGSIESSPATVTITVAPVNDAPVALADAYTTPEDTPLAISLPGVLGNDTDVDGNALTAVQWTTAAQGTISGNANGSFTYTPAENFNGTDTFTYTASDGSLTSAPATVTITVTPVNDPPVAVADSYGVGEDDVLTITAAQGVLANDSDIDGNPLTATKVGAGPSNGTLTFIANGSFTYTPNADYDGTDTFTYVANDGTVNSAVTTVTITVSPLNDPPIGVNDAYSVNEDTTLTRTAATGVLINDSDVDNNPLTAVLFLPPTHGSLTLSPDGSFTYTPVLNFNGTDTFLYRVSDGALLSAPVTVTISVAPINDAPVAAADSFATAEDTPLTIALPGVLTNDTDVDGNALTAVQWTTAAQGTISGNANGSFTYTPAENFNGTDTFTYKASDGLLTSAAATVTITVTPLNDAPVVVVPARIGTEGSTIALTATFTDAEVTDTHAAIIEWGDGTTSDGVVVESNGAGTVTGSHIYADNGVYDMVVRVRELTGSNPLTGVGTGAATIANAVPQLDAGISFTTTGTGSDERLAVFLTGRFTDAGFTPPLIPGEMEPRTFETFTVSVNWGDGTTEPIIPTITNGSNGALTTGVFSKTHNYSTAGFFTATVTVQDDDQGTAERQFNLGVLALIIDEKPTINLNSNGRIPVHIEKNSNPNINLALIDPTTVRFGPAGAKPTPNGGWNVTGAGDVRSHFYTQETGIRLTDTVAYMSGKFTDGRIFVGLDRIKIAPGNTPPPPVISPAGSSKFFVPDAVTNRIYRYDANGVPVANGPIDVDSAARGVRDIAIWDATPDNLGDALLWTIGSTQQVALQKTDGTTIGSWRAFDMDDPQGVTSDGQDIWTVDLTSRKLLRYSGLARMTSFFGVGVPTQTSSLHANNTNPVGITTDGSYLWVVDDGASANKVFVYTLDGVYEGSWEIDSANSDPAGITRSLTNSSHLWIVDRIDKKVYQYQGAKSKRSGSHNANPNAGFNLLVANGNPVGIADPMPGNYPPIAQNDTVYSVTPGVPTTINVRANDSDPEGGALTVLSVTAPAHGTATISGNNVVYTMAAGFTSDTFQYTISDPDEATATATVYVYAPQNFAPLAQADSFYGVSLTAPTTLNVLSNDSDPEGQALTITQAGSPPGASVTIGGNGTSLVLTPAPGFAGGSFQYTIRDPANNTATAMVSVMVTPNLAPQVGSDTVYGVTAGVPVTIQVLTNDFDPEGQSLAITGVTVPSYGTATIAPGGQAIIYTPAAGTPATSFQYTVQDGSGNTSTGTVTVQNWAYANAPIDPSGYDWYFGNIQNPGIAVDGTALQVAQAMAQESTLVTAASFVTRPSIQRSAAVGSGPLGIFGQGTDAHYGILSTGEAAFVNDPGQKASFDLGGSSVRGNTDRDVTVLKVDVNVPVGANYLTFDFQFLSEEFPYFIGSYNDGFLAELDQTTWTTSNGTINAPANFAKYPGDNPVSVAGIGYNGLSRRRAVGTAFDGGTASLTGDGSGAGTGVLRAVTPITPGMHSLYLSIFDQGDAVTDSSVLIRGLRAGTAPVAPAAGVSQVMLLDAWTVRNPFDAYSDVLVSGQAETTAPVTSVTVNGIQVQSLDAAGHFFTPVTAMPGWNEFVVVATDALGNQATDTIGFEAVVRDPNVIPFEILRDASASVIGQYGQTSFDERPDYLFADIAIHNRGNYHLDAPLLVGVTHISEPTVRVRDIDGYTPDGIPYFDLTDLLDHGNPNDDRTLAPGETTERTTLSFFNPERNPFTYELVVLGRLNKPPRFITAPIVRGEVGRLYQYDANAYDENADALTFKLITAPAGMTVNPTTGLLSWSPSGSDIGNHTVRVQVDDGRGGTDLQDFVVTVTSQVPNRPPQWVSSPVTEAHVNMAYAYPGRAVDPDGDTVAYSLVQGPTGLSIHPTTGAVSWVPTAGQVGQTHTVQLRAQDPAGLYDVQVYQILVLNQPGNRPPVIISEPSTYFEVAGLRQPASGAVDPTLIDLSLASGQTATVPVSLTIPTITDPDWPYADIVFVVDESGSMVDGDQEWIGTMATNLETALQAAGYGMNRYGLVGYGSASHAPVSPNGQAGHKHDVGPADADPMFGSAAQLSSAATGLINDGGYEDGYEAIQVALSYPFRPGAARNIILVTDEDRDPPTGEQPPPPAVILTRAEILGQLLAARAKLNVVVDTNFDYTTPSTFRLLSTNQKITERNAQQIAIERSGGAMNQAASVVVTSANGTATAGSDYTAISQTVEFAANQRLAYVSLNVTDDTTSEANETLTVSLTNPSTGTTIEPTAATSTITIADDEIAATQFRFVTSHGGQLEGVSMFAIGIERTGPITSAASVQVVVTGGTATLGTEFGILGSSTIEFAAGQSSGMVQITTSDDTISEATEYFTLALSSPSTGTIDPILGDTTVSIVDNEPATPLGFDYKGNTYIADFAGGFTIAGGGYITGPRSFETLTVNTDYVELAMLTNGAAWDIQKRRDGGLVEQSLVAGLVDLKFKEIVATFDYDIDLVATDSTGGFQNLTGVIENAQLGVPITFNAKFTGTGFSKAFNIQFVQKSTGVILGSIPINIGNNYLYDTEAIDPDDDPITYSLLQSPAGATINATTGKITWTPLTAGNHSFRVQAADNRGGIDIQEFVVETTMGSPNGLPEITSTPPTQAAVGRTYVYPVRATDPDMDPLTFSLEYSNPQQPILGLAINPVTGRITWKPTQDQIGSHTFYVRAADGRGTSQPQTVTVTVLASLPNTAPVIQSTGPIGAVVGSKYKYAPVATDAEADELAFDLPVRPLGMVIDPVTGLIAWVPTEDQVGRTHSAILRVQDPFGGIAMETIRIKVVATNMAPRFVTTVPEGPASSNNWFRYPARAVDPNGDAVTYSLDAASIAKGMTIHPTTGVFEWLPPTINSAPVTHTVTIAATDPFPNGKGTQTFTLIHAPFTTNRPPQFLGELRSRVRSGDVYFAPLSAIDPDGDRLTFSIDATFEGQAPPIGMSIVSANGGYSIKWDTDGVNLATYPIQVRVVDGRGGIDLVVARIKVISGDDNEDPVIVSQPASLNATYNREYSYQLQATDPDFDALHWSLVDGPAGVMLDPVSGLLLWTPSTTQIGQQLFVVKASDPYNGSDTQSFTLTVRGTNLPPYVTSTPVSSAIVGQDYRYPVRAIDPEGGLLTFAIAGTNSVGAAIPTADLWVDDQHVVQWKNIAAVGTYHITLTVTDDRGAAYQQIYDIVASNSGTSTDRSPFFTTLPPPPITADVGTSNHWLVQAEDPDGQTIAYSLTEIPVYDPNTMPLSAQMTIDSTTGQITWTPHSSHLTTSGLHYFTVKATSNGLSAAARIQLQVRPANRAPIIESKSPSRIIAGRAYQYDVDASDLDLDPLSYNLSNAPAGMTIDRYGRIEWKTPVTVAQVTTYNFQIAVADGRNGEAIELVALEVRPDTTAPKIDVRADPNPVNSGEQARILVTAIDDVEIASLKLTVNDQVVSLDERGVGYYTPANPGTYAILVTATDPAGNSAQRTGSLLAISPDPAGPNVAFNSPNDRSVITAPTPVSVNVSDPSQPASDLKSYTLDVRTLEGELLQTLAHVFDSNGGVIDPVNGAIATFDPTMLPNGAYVLRITATDLANHTRSEERTVNVRGNLKLGNFQVSFTDLTIPVSGIPITVTRSYDTLRANEQGDFGYGWKLGLGDAKIEVEFPDGGLGEFGAYPAFTTGTRVLVTQGDGTTEGFTFMPWEERRYLGLISVWHPYFEPDAGVITYLGVPDAELTEINPGEFISMDQGGISYNPADPAFGNSYTLHLLDGLAKKVTASTGEVETITDTRGNKLTITDGAIESNRGRVVTIDRDSANRITKITDPRGNSVTYAYDFAGNLIAMTDRTGNTTTDPNDRTTRFTYRTDRPHYLEQATDPFGRVAAKTYYGTDGRLSKIDDAQMKSMSMTYDLSNANNQGYVVEVKDQLDHIGKVTLDARGNVTKEVDQVGLTNLGTYDTSNYVTSQTTVIGQIDSIANGETDDLKTLYKPNVFGQPEEVTDPAGNVERTTYNENGQPISTTDALGNSSNYYYYYAPPPKPGQPWKPAPLAATADPERNALGIRYASTGETTVMRTGVKFDSFFLMDLYSNGNFGQYYMPGGPPLWPDLIETKMEYNSYGDLTKTISPLGIVSLNGRDANGNDTGGSQTIDGVVVSHPNVIDAEDRPGSSSKVVTENGTPRTLWTTSQTFNELGQSIGSTDQLNNLSETVYDTRGLVIESRNKVKDELGADVWLISRTVYDAAGRATYSTNPFIVGSSPPITGSRTIYDDAGRVTRTEQLEGLTINIVGTGNNLTSTLGSAGTMLAFSTTEYETTSGRVIKTIDQYGREAQTKYDTLGRTTQTRTETANSDGTAAWLISRTVYDSYGRGYVSTDSYVEGSTDPVYGTRTIYDGRGRAAKTERLQGVSVALAANGNTTLTTIGTVILSSRTIFDSKGRTAMSVAANGQVTRFEYDKYGRQTAVISHAILEGSTWVSHRTETEFDARGRRMVERVNVRAVWTADPNSTTSTATFTRDASVARATNFEYDVFGRLTKTTFADNSFTTTTYDDFDRKIAETDAVNQTTNFEYDAQRRLKAVVQPGVTNPANGQTVNPRTEYGYDAFGNHVSITDALGHVTKFGFDEQNRQASRTLPAVAGDPEAIETMAYNGYGDLDFTLDFKGQKADYVYDYEIANDTDLGLLRRVDYFNAGFPTPNETVGYTYDPFGRRDVVTETSATGARVTDTDYDGEGGVTRVLNADGEIHYGYNLLGQQVQMWTGSATTFAGGVTGIEYEYDAFGRLSVVRESRRNNATLSTPLETRYTFDRLGNVSKLAVTEGATTLRETNNTYDPIRFWLTAVENKSLGVVQSNFSYTRRVDGLITQVVESVKQPDTTSVGTTNIYTYDALNRLTVENVNTSTVNGDYVKNYTLDLVGNRTRLTTTPEGQSAIDTNSAYDNRDRLLTETTGSTIVNFGYDANGSLTSRNGGGSTLAQTWDLRNRLSGAVANGVTTAYKYTPEGIRSSVTETGVTTQYVIDSQSPSGYAQVVEERASGLLVVSYVYGTGLDPISMNRDTNASPTSLESVLYLADGHSGVRQALAAVGGAILAVYRYDAFGITVATAGTLTNPIGYRGERFDATLGQYYLRARFYDPRSGRFSSTDPLDATYSNVFEINRYLYGGGDGLNRTDPSGTSFAVALAIGAIVVLSGLITVGLLRRYKLVASRMEARIEFYYYVETLSVTPAVQKEVQRIFDNCLEQKAAPGTKILISWHSQSSRDALDELHSSFDWYPPSFGYGGFTYKLGFSELKLGENPYADPVGQSGNYDFSISPRWITREAQFRQVSEELQFAWAIAHEAGHHNIARRLQYHPSDVGSIDSKRGPNVRAVNPTFTAETCETIVGKLNLKRK